MTQMLHASDLPDLARGLGLLGSGGGGRTHLVEMMTARSVNWPLPLHDISELNPSTPCIAVCIAGSTLLLTERIPAENPFDDLLAAAQRWEGVSPGAVCALEGAGFNGLVPFMLADSLPVLDADLMGRALPRFDQVSLLADGLEGLNLFCQAGSQGVMMVGGACGKDAEHLVRSSLVSSGGIGPVLLSGFTVADLADHAITGGTSRALEWGSSLDPGLHLDVDEIARRLEGRVLASGRVAELTPLMGDPTIFCAEVEGDDGAVVRLISGSEHLAVVRDGVTVATCPEIIVALDSIARTPLEVLDIETNQHLTLIGLPAPQWWQSDSRRMAVVQPAAFGVEGL